MYHYAGAVPASVVYEGEILCTLIPRGIYSHHGVKLNINVLMNDSDKTIARNLYVACDDRLRVSVPDSNGVLSFR